MAKPLDSLHLVGTLHDAISANAVPLASVSGGARITPWLRIKSARDVPDAAMCSIREIYGDTGWCQPIVDG
jgi:hypothetical protein